MTSRKRAASAGCSVFFFAYIDSLQYTDEELQKYYEENKNSFDVANYEMITFNGAAASTKDADGNTVQPTEEVNRILLAGFYACGESL